MEVKSGVIIAARISTSPERCTAGKEDEDFQSLLIGLKIHEIEDFYPVLRKARVTGSQHIPTLARWLNEMFATNASVDPYGTRNFER